MPIITSRWRRLKDNMEKIAIIGGGGFCREVKCLIDDINRKTPLFDLIGFYDDSDNIKSTNGIKYLGSIETLNHVKDSLNVAVAIADPRTKKNILLKLNNSNLKFPNLFHPSVIKSNDDVFFGQGNIICAGNILTCNITVKDFVIVNLSCTVGHDTIIENYCSLMPNVNVSGEVILREMCYIGTGSTIINRVTVGKETVVGAGAVVAKSLPDFCTAVGIPAKPIKFGK